mgnify:CR=1 FL=1
MASAASMERVQQHLLPHSSKPTATTNTPWPSQTERKYKGFMHGGVQILRDEGIAGLYKGCVLHASLLDWVACLAVIASPSFPNTSLSIVPAALRECSYAAIRLALYDPIKTLLGENRADGVKGTSCRSSDEASHESND